MNAKANSLRQVAKHFGVSLWQVYKWKHQGCPELLQSPYEIIAIAEWREAHGTGKNANNEKNSKLRPAVVASIVGGAFVLLAAFIGLLVPIVSHYLGRYSNVVPTKAVPVTITSRSGVSIVLSNKSEIPESLTNVQITLSQTGSRTMIAGYRTYLISGEVDYAGSISGSAETLYDQLPDASVSFPVDGHVKVWSTGGWQLQIDVPVQEEIDGNGHFFIVLLLPDSMDVPSKSWLLGARNLGDYVSGESEKVFHLKRFLSDVGPMAIEVKIIYGEEQTGTYKSVIKFQTSD
jgi:hypothetical protein